MGRNDRNRVMCPACGQAKMQFDTERKARDFVRWNADGQPLHVYYCETCCCWHVSRRKERDVRDDVVGDRMKALERLRGDGRKKFYRTVNRDETAVRQAREIYRQLGELTYSSRAHLQQRMDDFLKDHPEYGDSHALRREVVRLHETESSKVAKLRR